MHIFHKWRTWSKPFDEKYALVIAGGLFVPPQDVGKTLKEYVVTKQTRTCEVCGKVQERVLE